MVLNKQTDITHSASVLPFTVHPIMFGYESNTSLVPRYSNQTLVGNWNEDRFDCETIRDIASRQPRLMSSAVKRRFTTTYQEDYSQGRDHLQFEKSMTQESDGLNASIRPQPAHQHERDLNATVSHRTTYQDFHDSSSVEKRLNSNGPIPGSQCNEEQDEQLKAYIGRWTKSSSVTRENISRSEHMRQFINHDKK